MDSKTIGGVLSIKNDNFSRVTIEFSDVFDNLYSEAESIAEKEVPFVKLYTGDVLAIAIEGTKHMDISAIFDLYRSNIREFSKETESSRRATITLHNEVHRYLKEMKEELSDEVKIKLNIASVIDCILVAYVVKNR